MSETWYILENGSPADPSEVSRDESGALVHRSGVAVAMGPHGPRSRGMSAEDIAAARERAAQKKASPPAADREMKAKPGGGRYETR